MSELEPTIPAQDDSLQTDNTEDPFFVLGPISISLKQVVLAAIVLLTVWIALQILGVA